MSLHRKIRHQPLHRGPDFGFKCVVVLKHNPAVSLSVTEIHLIWRVVFILF